MEIKIIPEQDYTDTVFCYQPNFISRIEINKLKQWIDSMTDFKYSSNYLQTGYSRLQKWYQVDQKYFCNQWKNKPSTWESFQYEPILYELQTGPVYNFSLIFIILIPVSLSKFIKDL